MKARANKTPLLSRGGESRRARSASPIGRSCNKSGGWGGAGQENPSVDQHHPVCAASVASRLLITGAATPPRLRRGASRVILSANVEHRTATAAFGFDNGCGVG